jgi:hypothetical protein
MTSFQPMVDEQLLINGVVYYVCAHPAAPTQPMVIAGDQGSVVQLRTDGGFAALKTVSGGLAGPALTRHAAQLQSCAALPGLLAAHRLILDPLQYPELTAARPALRYAVLMPWLYGPNWRMVLRTRRAVAADQALAAATQLAALLAELEQRGLAHGDLRSDHLLLPALDVALPTAAALVGLEYLHGNSIEEAAPLPQPAAGYRHRAAAQLLGPLRDRFAAALLITELLTWSEADVRAAAVGDSFFAPAELQQDSPRLSLLRAALQRCGGPTLLALFDRAWQSASPQQCPRMAEWRAALETLALQPSPAVAASLQPVAAVTQRYDAPPVEYGSAPTAAYQPPVEYGSAPTAAYQPPVEYGSAPTAAYQPPAAEATAAVSFETLLSFARSLQAQGRPTEAAAALRHALSTLPPGDPRLAAGQAELQSIAFGAVPPAFPAPPTELRRKSNLLPLIAAAAVLLLVVAIAAVWLVLRGSGAVVGVPATAPQSTSGAAVLPTRTPTDVPTDVPTVAAPLLSVSDVAPAELFTGDGRIAFVVRGSGLADVKLAELFDGQALRLPLTIGAGSSDSELRLSLATLPAGVSGLVTLTLELNAVAQPAAVITLRDFLEERSVNGVSADYTYTGRVAADALGPYATIHQNADVASPQTGLIRPADTLQVLSVAADGWYQVRVAAAAADSARLGTVGFVERWLVDNTAVPTPAPTNTPAASRRLRFVKLNENDSPNCMSVGISGIQTAGWTFTVDGTNIVGRFDASGNARACGLANRQEVTFTVRDAANRTLPGGVGVPARGSAIMVATWQ